MADLPYSPAPQQEAVGGGLPGESLGTPPGAFGAGVAEAAGSLGKTAEQIGQQQFGLAIKFQQLANETAANKASQDYADYVTQKETEFRQLQGQNAVDAFPAFQKDLQDRFQQTAGTLQSPMAQLAFQRDGRSFYQRSMYGAGLYVGDQAKKANDDAWMGRIATDRNLAVLHANDPEALQSAIDSTINSSLVLAHSEGMSPDAANAFVSKNIGDLFQDIVRAKVAAGDIDGAQDFVDEARTQKIPGTELPVIDGGHLAQISQTLATAEQRRLAKEEHDEVVAERHLRLTQTANEAELIADASSGKPIDPATLSNMLRTQQISVAGRNAILEAIREPANRPEDQLGKAHLWSEVTGRTATADDIYAAFNAGTINGATQTEMIKSLASPRQASSPLERADFNTLRTAVGLDATEHPLIELDDASKQAQIALWTQAQQEWSQRVLVNGENSTAVLNDMLGRYSHPIQAPAAWPKPRMGAINSSAEAVATAQRTEQAFKAGQIDQATYDKERRLILQYKNYYDLQIRRLQSAGKPPSGGGRLLGTTGAGQ